VRWSGTGGMEKLLEEANGVLKRRIRKFGKENLIG
jgi:hypothetical protein